MFAPLLHHWSTHWESDPFWSLSVSHQNAKMQNKTSDEIWKTICRNPAALTFERVYGGDGWRLTAAWEPCILAEHVCYDTAIKNSINFWHSKCTVQLPRRTFEMHNGDIRSPKHSVPSTIASFTLYHSQQLPVHCTVDPLSYPQPLHTQARANTHTVHF